MVDKVNHPVAAEIMSRFVQRTIRSKQYDARAKERLPGGDTRTATYFAPYPAYMMSGNGCYLFDVDGNKYLDLLNNYTSLIHGHAHPEIIVAANAQLKNGTVFGAASEIQFQHAEHLCNRITAMDQVRYCNSGTEATLFAIRAARAFTGRDIFIKMDGGYHGCHDAVEVNIFADPNSADSAVKHIGPGVSASVLEDVRIVPFNDLDAVEETLITNADSVAAIMTEPLMGAAGAICPQPGYLKGLRALADKYTVVLIFDEVMTFRLGIGGLQEIEDVKPDLTTLAKIIGGGMPIGAYGGKREFMSHISPEGPVYQAGTLSGNPVAVTAGIETLKLLTDEAYETLEELGNYFETNIQSLIDTNGWKLTQHRVGSMFSLFFTDQHVRNTKDVTACDLNAFNRYFHGMLESGVYLAPSQFEAGFLSLAHDKSILDTVLDTMEKVLSRIGM